MAKPGPRRVLVVEDDALNLELVRDILIAAGYEVLEAADGGTGMHVARAEHPELILMDLQLPGLDGLEAVRLIREDPSLREVPIVAVTAHAMKADDERARAAGCDGFVAKPIQVREFVTTVARYLDHPRTDPADGEEAKRR